MTLRKGWVSSTSPVEVQLDGSTGTVPVQLRFDHVNTANLSVGDEVAVVMWDGVWLLAGEVVAV